MLNLKLILRQLLKQRSFTFINLIGLTITLMVTVVIFSFAYYHFSFDQNVKNPSNSYRICNRLGQGTYWATTFPAFNKVLKNNPHLESSTVFFKQDESFELVKDDTRIQINDPVYADSSYINFFSITVKLGSAKDLDIPNSVLISKETAYTFFGVENPIGKTLNIKYGPVMQGTNRTVTVVGVLGENTKKTHIKHDIIHSKRGFYEETLKRIEHRKFNAAYVYLTLAPNVSSQDFKSTFYDLLNPALEKQGPLLEDFDIHLQPLSDIHFTTGHILEISPTIKRSHLNILMIVGLLLFITTALNFLIMNIALFDKNIKQTMITRILGANLRTLLGNKFLEVTIFAIFSSVLAVLGIYLLSPIVANHFFNGWETEISSLIFWIILLTLGGSVIITTVILSVPEIVKLNGTGWSGKKTTKSHRAIPLIVFQFTVVIALICFGFILNKQLNHIQQKDLGYTSENVMIFKAPSQGNDNIKTFKERVRTIPGVQATGNARHYPGFRLQDVSLETLEGIYPFKFAMIDEDVLDVLNIKVDEELSETEKLKIYINQTMYNSFLKGFSKDDIIAGNFHSKQQADSDKFDFYVNGIVNDFHYSSLYEQIGNFAFFIQPKSYQLHRFLMVRYLQVNTAQIIEEVQSIAKSIYGIEQIEPIFLNEELNKQYKSEEQLLKITNVFSILTILIACMGLLAFTLYSMQLRTKEIGLRKVNGAKTSEILFMLNKNFIKWVVIAFVIACPIAYYAMEKWLENFAYKTELSWWIFALSGMLTLGIALLTVSWQSWRAATRNPVEALRDE